MAVHASALTTLTNLKSAVQIASSDTSKDTLLEQCIDRASQWIEGATDRKLKARKYNNGGSTHATTTVADEDYIFFSGNLKNDGGDTIVDERGYGLFYLLQFPVQTNSVLTFVLAILSTRDAAGETWDTSTLAEWRDYVIERETGTLRLLNGRFSPAYRNYRVTMAAGYQYGSAQPYVPPDLEQLCIAVARKMFRNEAGLQSESLGTWSRTYNAEKEQEFIDATIARYRRLSL